MVGWCLSVKYSPKWSLENTTSCQSLCFSLVKAIKRSQLGLILVLVVCRHWCLQTTSFKKKKEIWTHLESEPALLHGVVSSTLFWKVMINGVVGAPQYMKIDLWHSGCHASVLIVVVPRVFKKRLSKGCPSSFHCDCTVRSAQAWRFF